MSDDRPFLLRDFTDIVGATLEELASGRGGRVVLDDATEGSVVRTLVEAFAREAAVAYLQLESVYRAGYLDTAEGAALDRVVELLGVERQLAGWLEGDVEFSRATPAPFDIDIPAGTLVAGRNVQAFETLVPARLGQVQREVRVPVRSLVPEGDPVGPQRLSILQRPIPGIESVTNPGDLLPRRESESDADLRERARRSVQGGRTATVSALERAVLAIGLVNVQVIEDPARPGRVDVVLGDAKSDNSNDDPELDEAKRRIEEVRPVGVRVDVYRAMPVRIRVQVVIQLASELTPQASAALQATLEAEIGAVFDRLRVNETVRWNQLRNLIAAHPEVAEVTPPLGQNPLIPVDVDGRPIPEGDGRVLGTPDDPTGVFIRADERAQRQAIALTIEPPELPVWIDVEGTLLPGKDASAAEAALREALIGGIRGGAGALPREPLGAPLTITWELLMTSIESAVGKLVDIASLRFVILHGRDGRVVTLAGDATGSERETFAVRERIQVRNVRLRAAGA